MHKLILEISNGHRRSLRPPIFLENLRDTAEAFCAGSGWHLPGGTAVRRPRFGLLVCGYRDTRSLAKRL